MANRNTRIRGIQILDKGVDTAQIADSAIEALQINADAVTTVKILDENVTVGKMADMGLEAHILVADAGLRPVSVAVSGDVTIGATGVVAIGVEKVEEAMLDCDNVPDTAKVLGWSGSQLSWVEGITEANLVMNETVDPDTGSDTDYTLANSPVADSVTVYLNGLLQQPGTGEDYIISGSTITFAEAVDASDIVLACYFIS